MVRAIRMEDGMAEFLLDSNVAIQHLRGHRPTTELLMRLAAEGLLAVSAITRTEVLAEMRDAERGATVAFLDALACYPIDRAVADRAGALLRTYRRRGVTLDVPDALIAATALQHDLTLLTYNARHFPMPEVRRYGEMPALQGM